MAAIVTDAQPQAGATAPADDAKKVFAGNLAFSTTEDDLKKVFEEAGAISHVQIIKRGTRSLGYGFVTYNNEADAQKAVSSLDKREIDGREINVEGAKPQASLKAVDGNADGDDAGKGRRGRRTRGRGGATSRRPRNDDGEEGTAAESGKENAAPEAGPDGGVSKSAKRRQKKKLAAAANGEAPGEVNASANPARQPRKPKGPPQGEPSKTLIFVANLPFVFSDEQLKGAFEGFKIKSATVVKRRFGTRTKGFGFVDFEDESEQQRALKEVAGKEVEGRPLSMKVAIQGDDRKAHNDAAADGTTQAETVTVM